MILKNEQNLINKITDILQLYPDLFEVADVLNEYRKEPDPHYIYHKLCDLEEAKVLESIEFSKEGITTDENGIPKFFSYWINIGDDFAFQVRNLKSFKKTEIWEDNRQLYCIKVNEVVESTAMNVGTNTEIRFYSEQMRDLEWSRVKTRLSIFNSIRFL